ncbi:MAG: hypothetical protein HYV16_09260 [Gammaproteobacteria bacterium]|nr:hypothetical protein [Gammaproteobacteria bacterium]
MQVSFPNAQHYQCPLGLFVAAWKVWFKRFAAVDPYAWREGVLPLRSDEAKLAELLNHGYRFSLDVMARLLVPWPYRNTPQVVESFLRLNDLMVKSADFMEGDQVVAGARLSEYALDTWDQISLLEQDQYLSHAEARIQADVETTSNDPIVIDDGGVALIGENIYPPQIPAADADTDAYLHALAAWLQEDPLQPIYSGRPIGEAVSGWDQRLVAFFWPKPRSSFAHNRFMLEPMLFRAARLAHMVEMGEDWGTRDQAIAVKLAHETFNLAGMPQREVTPENIRRVFEAALAADIKAKAKMNSGWSALAAVATAHLEEDPERQVMVLWDSRVAASLLSRLDFLMVEAGREDPQSLFPELGTVPGWGGTRPRQLSLDWPSGYRRWATLVAVSRVIMRLRDILNTSRRADGRLVYPRMPMSEQKDGPWTTHGVQMVLFCDGY